jgi:hypothetical protein
MRRYHHIGIPTAEPKRQQVKQVPNGLKKFLRAGRTPLSNKNRRLGDKNFRLYC